MNRHVEPPAKMSFVEFATFYRSRPHGEKWELLEGHVVLNASPSPVHQSVLVNLCTFLEAVRRLENPGWRVLPGLALHVDAVPQSAPEPDVLIVPEAIEEAEYHSHPLVVFEILSPSTRKRDLGMKCDVYRRMPTIKEYVVIAPRTRDVTLFSRDGDWSPKRYMAPDDVVSLASLGLRLPLSEIYYDLLV